MIGQAEQADQPRAWRYRTRGIKRRLGLTRTALRELAHAWGTETVQLSVRGVDHVLVHSLANDGYPHAQTAGALGRIRVLLGKGPWAPELIADMAADCADCQAMLRGPKATPPVATP